MSRISKDEIIDYAKHLFFENKSFRQISELIETRFKEKYSHVSIKNWSLKCGWQATKNLAIAKGVYVAKKQNENNENSNQIPLSSIGADEKLEEKIAKDLKKQYEESKEIRSIGLNLARIQALEIKIGKEKGSWNKDFDFKRLSSALQAFKAGSEDMRKIEELADRANNFDPTKLSDEELERIING